MVIIFWDLLMFDQILMFDLSPQVKWSLIISNKHDIYKLPRELLNGLRLAILEEIRKYQENLKTW